MAKPRITGPNRTGGAAKARTTKGKPGGAAKASSPTPRKYGTKSSSPQIKVRKQYIPQPGPAKQVGAPKPKQTGQPKAKPPATFKEKIKKAGYGNKTIPGPGRSRPRYE